MKPYEAKIRTANRQSFMDWLNGDLLTNESGTITHLGDNEDFEDIEAFLESGGLLKLTVKGEVVSECYYNKEKDCYSERKV